MTGEKLAFTKKDDIYHGETSAWIGETLLWVSPDEEITKLHVDKINTAAEAWKNAAVREALEENVQALMVLREEVLRLNHGEVNSEAVTKPIYEMLTHMSGGHGRPDGSGGPSTLEMGIGFMRCRGCGVLWERIGTLFIMKDDNSEEKFK